MKVLLKTPSLVLLANSIIMIMMILSTTTFAMHIYVKDVNSNQRPFVLEVDSEDTVDAVRARIEKSIGLSKHDLILRFDGKNLFGFKTLNDQYVVDKSVLEIITSTNNNVNDPEHKFIKITIETKMQWQLTMEVKLGDTIESLKQSIEEIEGIPFERQRLFFNERILNDKQKLNDCEIEDNSTLQLLLSN